MPLTWKQKFDNGMRAKGLNPNDEKQVKEYLESSPVARKKKLLADEEKKENASN